MAAISSNPSRDRERRPRTSRIVWNCFSTLPLSSSRIRREIDPDLPQGLLGPLRHPLAFGDSSRGGLKSPGEISDLFLNGTHKGEGGAFFSRYKSCLLLTSSALNPDSRASKPIFSRRGLENDYRQMGSRLNDKNGGISRMGLRVPSPGKMGTEEERWSRRSWKGQALIRREYSILITTASPAGLQGPRQMIFSPFFIDKKPPIMMKSGDCSAPAGTDSGRFPENGEEVRSGYALPEDDIARFVPSSGPVTGSLPGRSEKGTDVMHTAFIGGIENET